MLQELKFQLSTAILTILTLAVSVAAVVNFGQYRKFHLPDDGIVWVDRAGGVEALAVAPDSSGDRAHIHPGDRLLRIQGTLINRALDVPQILARLGAWSRTTYTIDHIEHRGIPVEPSVIVGEAPRNPAFLYLETTGAAYLLIGLFVYYRRGSAQKAQHFYILCLTSFAAFTLHYTGNLDAFDTLVYFVNVAAGVFAPTIFLHFCLTFPERRKWFQKRVNVALLYLPALLLTCLYMAVSTGALKTGIPAVDLRWLVDRFWVLIPPVLYLFGAYIFNAEYRRTEDPIVRQQLKWQRNGAVCGALPYGLCYALPFALGAIPGFYQSMTVLSMVLIPLTVAYAIVRYRLMDVDILFRRGYAYTLATLCVVAAFYGTIFWLGNLVAKWFPGPDGKPSNFRDATSLIVMLTAAFLFQPIRNWIQERLDKHFYSDQYDYRRTLVEFARELGSQMDLDTMLASVGDRLLKTLSIKHLGFFLAEDGPAGPVFQLKSCMGNNPRKSAGAEEHLDLSFLDWKLPESYLFFERTHHQLDAISRSWPVSVRQTIAELDFTYYLPCKARGRTIAYIGVSRSTDGEYLSSVDVELLLTLTGYVAIAIENASLYSSLQLKVEEYERLKEFSENIVESINVGILAADLEDRVESWNSQIEQLSGVTREKALGRKLSEIFPRELTDQFDHVRGETGIHHIYKFVLKPTVSVAVATGNGNGTVNGNGHSLPARFREATLNIAIAPLVSKDQEQIGRLIIFDDVTDRAELEQRLVQADKLSSIGLLAAGVAHEVNTPLAVISTYAQMLAKQMAEDSPQKTLILDKIAKQTFRASEIVNSLLNFSRTSSTSFGDVNLNRVVQETLSLLEHQLQKSGVRITTDLDAGLPPIHGNTGKLQQVFLNLFLNARDAMSGGGSLEVRTWRDGGTVKVDVADSGHGIAPEHLRRIYDPFFTTKGAQKGTGLGLSVTYGIIQEHGGSIEVTNRPDGGARFRLELPVSRAAARTPVNAA
ncbi:MAG: ATP-binding protein [Ignavibacteriota bacterium]